MTKVWWKSKTVWFNILSTFLVILSIPELAQILPEAWLPWLGLFVALGNIYLRFVSNKEITLK